MASQAWFLLVMMGIADAMTGDGLLGCIINYIYIYIERNDHNSCLFSRAAISVYALCTIVAL